MIKPDVLDQTVAKGLIEELGDRVAGERRGARLITLAAMTALFASGEEDPAGTVDAIGEAARGFLDQPMVTVLGGRGQLPKRLDGEGE